MRSNEALWEKIKKEITAENVMGTKSGQWSARKAQLAVKRYKEAGGKYIGEKTKNNSLVKWTQQDWRTKSGKPSHITGERYLPAKAISALSDKEYKETSKAKRKGMKEGVQFVSQPKDIAEKVKEFRQ